MNDLTNALIQDLIEKLEDPVFWTDEEIERKAKEIFERYAREGTPVGCEAAAEKARKIMSQCDRTGKDQAGRPLDLEYEINRCIAILSQMSDRDREPTLTRCEK